MQRSIILIGFMGTGKTTVGRMLSERTGMPFYDSDNVIEVQAGKSIPDIFKTEGEKYFREMERQAIASLTQKRSSVIATGGGAVLDSGNFERMKASGVVIALMASPETLWSRLQGGSSRPLLAGSDARERLLRLYREREALYQGAHYITAVDEKSPLQVTEEILAMLQL